MINTIKPVIIFALKLILLLAIILGIHIAVLSYLNLPLFENYIVYSYTVNVVLAVVIYVTLFKLRVKYLDLLGFIFMGGSFLKFAVFFIFFNPLFKDDGSVSSAEIASFLVPYLACLIIETFYLIKLLNNKL